MDSPKSPEQIFDRRTYLTLVASGVTGGIAHQSGLLSDSVRGDRALSKELAQRIQELLQRFDIPGAAIAIVRDGTVSWTNAYGYADVEGHRPMTTNTICRLESITKSITAWGIMRLVEDDLIELNTSVTEYVTSWDFPTSEFDWECVTIRRLLSHTAGLPGGIFDNFDIDEQVPPITDVLDGQTGDSKAVPIDDPGSGFRYSNPGFVLLELVIEDVTDEDYADFIETSVLQPLGMNQATFQIDSVKGERLAKNYTRTGDPLRTYHEPARAHGMLVASIEDMAAFVAASVSGQNGSPIGSGVLEEATVQTMHRPEIETSGFHSYGSDAYSLGHLVETLPTGETAVMHGGQGSGSWTWFHAVPETGDGIVVLTNSERGLRLIATVVSIWAEQSDYGSTKLSRTYSRVESGMMALVGGIGIVTLGLATYLGRGIYNGSRKFEPTSDKHRLRRITIAIVVLGLFTSWWLAGYPFVDQLLPELADWLGIALTSLLLVVGLYTVMISLDWED